METEFDLDNLFFRFTLNSFAEMAFGTDVGALSLDSDDPVPFAAAFDFAQSVLDRRFNKCVLCRLTQLEDRR